MYVFIYEINNLRCLKVINPGTFPYYSFLSEKSFPIVVASFPSYLGDNDHCSIRLL